MGMSSSRRSSSGSARCSPPLNAGQIYTTLSRLERDGLVDDDAVAQNGRPNKRVYRLTEQGRVELSGWVADSTPPTRLKDDFFIKLVLARAAGSRTRSS